MSTPGGWFVLAESDGHVFSDAKYNDLVVYTSDPSQTIKMGTSNSAGSTLTLSGSKVLIHRDIEVAGKIITTNNNLEIQGVTLSNNSLRAANINISNTLMAHAISNVDVLHTASLYASQAFLLSSTLNQVDINETRIHDGYILNANMEKVYLSNLNVQVCAASNIYNGQLYSKNVAVENLIGSNIIVTHFYGSNTGANNIRAVVISSDILNTSNCYFETTRTCNASIKSLVVDSNTSFNLYTGTQVASNIIASMVQVNQLTTSNANNNNTNTLSLYATDAILSNAIVKNLNVNNVLLQNATFSNFEAKNANSFISTTSNLFASTSIHDYLQASNVSISNLSVKNASNVSAYITNLNASNIIADQATISLLKADNSICSNLFIDQQRVKDLYSSNASINNANINQLNLNVATSISVHASNLRASNVYASTLSNDMSSIQTLFNTSNYTKFLNVNDAYTSNLYTLNNFISTGTASIKSFVTSNAFVLNHTADLFKSQTTHMNMAFASNLVASNIYTSNAYVQNLVNDLIQVQQFHACNAYLKSIINNTSVSSNATISNANVQNAYVFNMYSSNAFLSNLNIDTIVSVNTAASNLYAKKTTLEILHTSNAVTNEMLNKWLYSSNITALNANISNVSVSDALVSQVANLRTLNVQSANTSNVLFSGFMSNVLGGIIFDAAESRLTSTNMIATHASNMNMSFSNIQGTFATVGSNLYVGNGVENKDARAVIAGDLVIMPNTSPGQIRLRHDASSAFLTVSDLAPNGDLTIQVRSNNTITNGLQMYMKPSGMIGIGCNQPKETLVVKGTGQIFGTLASQKSSHPLASALVVHYVFDEFDTNVVGVEAEGIIYDHSKHARRARVFGTWSRTSRNTFPAYGNAVFLNSEDAYIEMLSQTPLTNTLSIALWLYYSPSNMASGYGIICASSTIAYIAVDRATGALGYLVFSGSVFVPYGTIALQYDKWYHLAVVINSGSVVCLYMNGVCVGEVASYGVSHSVQLIGNISTGGRACRGEYSDVRVYNRCLQANEIAELVNLVGVSHVSPSVEYARKVVLYDTCPSNDNQFFGFGVVNNTLVYQAPSNKTHAFYVGSSNNPNNSVEAMRIDTSGALVLSDLLNKRSKLILSSNGASIGYSNDIMFYNANTLQKFTSSLCNDILVITNAGNIGIGTSNPQYTIHVNGTIAGNGAAISNLNALNITGIIPVARGGTGVTTSTGSGSNVLNVLPTLSNPIFNGVSTLSNPTGAVTISSTGQRFFVNNYSCIGPTGELEAALSNASVTSAKVASNAILGHHIKSDVITTTHIQDNSITPSKFSSELQLGKVFTTLANTYFYTFSNDNIKFAAQGWSNLNGMQYSLAQSEEWETYLNSGPNKPMHMRLGNNEFITLTPFMKLGIRNTAPEHVVHVCTNGTSNAVLCMDATQGTGYAGMELRSSNGITRIDMLKNTSNIWSITGSNNNLVFANSNADAIMTLEQTKKVLISGTLIQTSDSNLKENFAKLQSSLEKIQYIDGYTFNMKNYPSETRIGLIAQQVESVIPEAVMNIDGVLALDYAGLSALYVESIKELKKQISSLQQEVYELKASKISNFI